MENLVQALMKLTPEEADKWTTQMAQYGRPPVLPNPQPVAPLTPAAPGTALNMQLPSAPQAPGQMDSLSKILGG